MSGTAAVFGARPGGIGASCASLWARELGLAGVAVMARREASVRETGRRLRAELPALHVYRASRDLTRPDAPEALLGALRRARLPDGSCYLDRLRVVIFAAGTVVPDRGSPEELRAMHAIKGPHAERLIGGIAEEMASRRDGTARSIVLVGSLAALMPVPSLGEYCASNRRLLELARWLDRYRKDGVSCTYCAPGYVKSALLRQQIEAAIPNPWARLSTWYAADPPERVAREIFRAARAREPLVIPGSNARTLYANFRLARSLGALPYFRLAQDLAARWSGY